MLSLREQIDRLLEPLHRKMRNSITRGLVKLIDTETLLQSLQVELLDGTTLDNVEYAEPYGYTSSPKSDDDNEAIVLSVNGSKKHSVIISCFNRKYRLKGLKGGEVALYTDEGDSIILKRGGIIHHKASTKIILETPLAEATGDFKAGGDISDAEGSLKRLRDNYNAHTNAANGTAAPVPQDA